MASTEGDFFDWDAASRDMREYLDEGENLGQAAAMALVDVKALRNRLHHWWKRPGMKDVLGGLKQVADALEEIARQHD